MVTKLVDTALDRALIGYGNVGYLARRRAWEPLPRLDGKVVIVTGAKAGLGRASRGRARSGRPCTWSSAVHVGSGARRDRRDAAGRRVVVDALDVSLLADVRAFAAAWEGPLHAVVHNAGVMPPERGETRRGPRAHARHPRARPAPADQAAARATARSGSPRAACTRRSSSPTTSSTSKSEYKPRDRLRADQAHAGRAGGASGRKRGRQRLQPRTRAGSTRRASPTRCRCSRRSRARSCARPSRARTPSCGSPRRGTGAARPLLARPRGPRRSTTPPSPASPRQDRRALWNAVEALSEASA